MRQADIISQSSHPISAARARKDDEKFQYLPRSVRKLLDHFGNIAHITGHLRLAN
jgi:hypothetical protein